jgi:hypothetical protein
LKDSSALAASLQSSVGWIELTNLGCGLALIFSSGCKDTKCGVRRAKQSSCRDTTENRGEPSKHGDDS